MLNFGLNGKVVAISGGASGIGFATAAALARDGAKVAILDLEHDQVNSAVTRLGVAADRAIGITVDVRSEHAMAEAAAQVERELGNPFGLVASAGVSTASPAHAQPIDEWERVLSVNLTGAFITCREFGGRMRQSGGGSIVVIGSILGLGAQPARVAYSSSKFAITGMVKTLAMEWGLSGIRVNCVAPTLVDTPLLRANLPDGFLDLAVDRTPMGRIADTEDIALTVMMFLSDATRFVNGAILPVDGGLSTGFFTHRSGTDLLSKKLLEAGVYEE